VTYQSGIRKVNDRALAAVRNGDGGLNTASREYCVPEEDTLSRYLDGTGRIILYHRTEVSKKAIELASSLCKEATEKGNLHLPRGFKQKQEKRPKETPTASDEFHYCEMRQRISKSTIRVCLLTSGYKNIVAG
jgi:hypothetical protein